MARCFVWAGLGGGVCLSLATAACSDGNVVRDDVVAMGGTHSPPGGNTAMGGANPNTEGGTNAAGGAAAIPVGQGVGEDCSEAMPCRDGLACSVANTCAPAGDKAEGDACVLGAECKDGQCVDRQCVAAGAAAEREACMGDRDCGAGLRCAIVGLRLSCMPEGMGDVDADCATSADCFAGLACLASKCDVTPAGTAPFGEAWQGVECSAPATSGVKAYFEVPGAKGADEGDFFRLPFPTDVRRAGDKLDLSGFPTPGSTLLGVDPVQLYVDAISENDSGWGTYPTVIFRFSGNFDYRTFNGEATQFIDVTDPAKGRSIGWRRFFTDARTNYVCENFVALQPPFGSPLEPGHTYAAFILSHAVAGLDEETVAVKDADSEACMVDADCAGVCTRPPGTCSDDKKVPCKEDADCEADAAGSCDWPAGDCETPVVASENMAAVLQQAAPSDPKLKAAHRAFAPLRDYLAAKGQLVSNVLTASVFTVGDVRAPMTELSAAVKAAPLPTAGAWVKCGGATPSPCPDAEGERACGEDVAGYDEYHALLTIPVFQQGMAPYLTPDDGGAIDTTNPSREDVCLSITVPEGAPPTAGWPAVVFAHGTGGDFRNHVRAEVAGVLASATPKFAVIGIDQVEHGPRRGGSTESPDNLFFNFLNPAATRGNPLQGAADQLSVARFAKVLSVDAATTTGSAIKLDGTKLFFFGHSQGSTEGSLMLPFGDDYKAAVLSGNGASLRDALRTKTKPENIAAALPLVLQDPTMSDPKLGPGVTLNHPVLSLLQQWIDPADPLNFAGLIGEPLAGHTGKHAFQTFGVDDNYSPPVTMATFAVAGGFVQVRPDASAEPSYADDSAPLPEALATVGYQAPANGFSLGLRQYGAPKNRDGHFVVFDTQAANDDMVLFLSTAAGATPPVIGQ
jgi:hypothetical protein